MCSLCSSRVAAFRAVWDAFPAFADRLEAGKQVTQVNVNVNGISSQCVKGPSRFADWWQLLLDGVVVPHIVASFGSRFEGYALEGELQRWAFQQVD